MKPSLGLSSGVSRDTISLDCCGDWATLRSRQPRKYVTEYMKRPTKSAPQNYSIRSGRSVVLASRCLRPGRCEAATSGTLHLSKFSEGKGASGEYELHFQDGSVEKGSFDATWCVARLICG